MSSEVSSLKKHEDALQKLCEQLVDVWKDLGFSLEDLIIKKAQQKEQVMRWAMTTRDELDSL